MAVNTARYGLAFWVWEGAPLHLLSCSLQHLFSGHALVADLFIAFTHLPICLFWPLRPNSSRRDIVPLDSNKSFTSAFRSLSH
ncbi:hypothetical protein BS47DRAFT_1029405 [Hydnum rufescens UP504]|uniref:Uncharacterized protein n=1 Tax=Hydnum rufescens UP504 TaxID=1448309 RepID=A0A9P6AXY9_9AGAM|nr:hypothetical protein BS47DRAFT_1029405 [Hydnum rufescens UP504]